MTDYEKKNHILSSLSWDARQARNRYVEAVASHASIKVKKEMTDEMISKEEFTGGFGSTNPHDESLRRCEVSMESCKKELERHDEILSYATNIFLLK